MAMKSVTAFRSCFLLIICVAVLMAWFVVCFGIAARYFKWQ